MEAIHELAIHRALPYTRGQDPQDKGQPIENDILPNLNIWSFCPNCLDQSQLKCLYVCNGQRALFYVFFNTKDFLSLHIYLQYQSLL